MSLKCPKKMVFKRHNWMFPHEPAYCLDKSVTSQDEFMTFLSGRFGYSYREISTLMDKYTKSVYATWGEAQAFCEAKYPGGHLPTIGQWQMACGRASLLCGNNNEITVNGKEWLYNASGKRRAHTGIDSEVVYFFGPYASGFVLRDPHIRSFDMGFRCAVSPNF